MQPPYHQAVHRFALFLVACTLLLLIAGALVTSNEAALSVPDWPLSYGTLLPPMVGGIVFEDSHRKIAGAVLLLTLILAIRSEEHTSELQSRQYLVCRLL